MKTRRFVTGFALGLLIFLLTNLLAAHLASDCGLPALFGRDACADDIARAGWPLQFYEEGGFAYRNSFSLPLLFLNALIAMIFSLFIGWVIARRKKPLPK